MSTILSADDLNDFISPGVACIKPVEIEKSNNTGKAEIEIGIDGIPIEISQDGQSKQTLKSAQISLTDCLACSGCITSAETVLVSMQSHTEVLSAIKKNNELPVDSNERKIFVASISHQVRVSLAAAYGISISQVDAKLRDLLVTKLGFRYVVGTEIGRAISLEYAADEVVSQHHDGPILCSSCPGWTCYVEKTHPHIIPFLSKVKSAQQITGTLIKDLIGRHQQEFSPDRIYHVSIMPCFDKKLEAARPEFGESESIRDVDCVITAKEIIQLLLNEDIPFESLSDKLYPHLSDNALSPDGWPYEYQWLSHQGSSSGGYLEHVLGAIIKERSQENTRIEILPGKNSDIIEYHVIRESDNQIIGRVAQIYGFRNIQNLVRKLKPTKRGGVVRKSSSVSSTDPAKLDYIEVMACPGGCINGGGQIGRPEGVTSKEWKDRMEEIYQNIDQQQITHERISKWVELWTRTKSYELDRLIRAQYQAIVTTEPTASTAAITLGTKW